MQGKIDPLKEKVVKASNLKPEIYVPGDKSITHRAVMFGSIAEGSSTVKTNILGRDNFATIRIFQQLGVEIELDLNAEMYALAKSERIKNIQEVPDRICTIKVKASGINGLKKPESELDCGNSGTTGRLLCGLLSAVNFPVTLVGDESLSKRPFARVTEPLTRMGASFSNSKLPITITGAKLNAINFESPKASAQVKSAIIIAGMFASGISRVSEPFCSRDHTEKMLKAMGAKIQSEKSPAGVHLTTVEGPVKNLNSIELEIPGDISAAMFFIVAALINPKREESVIKSVGINPTRSACLDILKRMGAQIQIEGAIEKVGELTADIRVKRSSLKGIEISKSDVALAIDEIPIIALAASFAEGETRITGGEELRVKESDRIAMTVALLNSFGVEVEELPDGLVVKSSPKRSTCDENNNWKVCGDHRISMCGAIMEYLLSGEMRIYDMPAIETSFPSFLDAFCLE